MVSTVAMVKTQFGLASVISHYPYRLIIPLPLGAESPSQLLFFIFINWTQLLAGWFINNSPMAHVFWKQGRGSRLCQGRIEEGGDALSVIEGFRFESLVCWEELRSRGSQPGPSIVQDD